MRKFTLEKPMAPLWLMYPSISPYSIGWRMGYAEEYKNALQEWIDALKEEEREQYKIMFPAPKPWKGYWDEDFDVGDDEEDDFEKNKFEILRGLIEYWQPYGVPFYSFKQLESKEDPSIIEFSGKETNGYEWLAQNWICEFTVDTDTYCCMEQYMMAKKARLFLDGDSEKSIMLSNDPKEIVRLGRNIANFNEDIWNKVKYSIALNGNYAKFLQNEQLKKRLFETKDSILVQVDENDTIWSVRRENGSYVGENYLGFAIMEVRDELMKACKMEHLIDFKELHKIYD